MFDAYCRLTFDPRGIHVEFNKNKTISKWSAPKTIRSFFNNNFRYSHNKGKPSDLRTNPSQVGRGDDLGPSPISNQSTYFNFILIV